MFNFRPWIGKNYSKNGYKGKKILVLGESHYCTKQLSEGGRCYPCCRSENMKEDCHTQTQDTVESIIYEYDGENSTHKTFLCFERAVVGRILTDEEREEFWQGVMFYNYIQFSQCKAQEPLHQDQWELFEKLFRQLLEEYLPDYIIVWGDRLYECLPDWGGKRSTIQIESGSTDVWTYNINGKDIPALRVLHPCVPKGKNREYWHEFHKRFLGID